MKSSIFFAAIVFILIIAAYTICFYDTSLSDDTSDWGAFGSYIGMGISFLSVTLIFVTYNEQRQANRIGMFEQQMRFMFDRLSVMIERHKDGIEEETKKIEQHFLIPFGGMNIYERLKVRSVCSYYFSELNPENRMKYENIFIYLTQMINYIRDEKSINSECVRSRMIELSCILTEYIRLYYFFWLTSQSDDTELLRFCYLNYLFLKEESDSLLDNTIRYVCTGIISDKNNDDSSEVNLVIEDYSNENFHTTYHRLFGIL